MPSVIIAFYNGIIPHAEGRPSAFEPVMDGGARQEPRVSRSGKAVKGKRKGEAKRARPAVIRRAVPERMRSEKVTHGAGNYGTDGSVARATNAVPKMNDGQILISFNA
jgi:hypothetical protein